MGAKERPPSTPKKPKAWDSLPRGSKGDVTPEITYVAIGKALSAWEYFENSLATLFSRFLGIRSDNLPALRAYGSVLSFRGRAEMVKAAAHAFFFANPDTALPKMVDDLIDRGIGFSARRNEIAHGVVSKVQGKGRPLIRPGGGVMLIPREWGYGVVPSEYATNKTTLAPPLTLLHDVTRVPKYTYAAAQIDIYTGEFIALGAETQELSKLLLERNLRGHS